jgi:hypothetical protein
VRYYFLISSLFTLSIAPPDEFCEDSTEKEKDFLNVVSSFVSNNKAESILTANKKVRPRSPLSDQYQKLFSNSFRGMLSTIPKMRAIRAN